jgi:2-haloacid dehalogenase
MRPALVFDVLETLVDLRGLEPSFARGFGEGGVRAEWFDALLHLVFTATITAAYEPFDALAAAALRIVERAHATTLDDMTRRSILEGLGTLPAHPDAVPALERLQDAGFLLHALSNETQKATDAVLRAAGLHRFFITVQSAEFSESYKPKAQVYRNALAHIDVSPRESVYVSAHPWDVAGARSFGMPSAFVARGAVLDPEAEQPAIVAAELGAVADKLIYFPLTTLAASSA